MIEIIGLNEVFEYFQDTERILYESVKIGGESLVADMSERIHEDGLDTNGNKIASGYSEKPYFTYTSRFINKQRVPKRLISKSTGLTTQLPEGYKSFRKFSGRTTDTVNLDYSGHLRTSMRFIEEDVDLYRLGFIGDQSPDREGLSAAQKAEFLENQYAKEIFSPSNDEIEAYLSDIEFEWVNRE